MGIAWTGCCGDGGLTVVEGEWPVAPGGSVSFRFDFDGDFIAGPEKCGGYWYVNEGLWGSPSEGVVTNCGVYSAPLEPPCDTVVLTAMQYPDGQCADCCPYARKTLVFASCNQEASDISGTDEDGFASDSGP